MAGDFPLETDTDDSDSDFVEFDPSGRYGRVSWSFREFDSFLATHFLIFHNYMQIDALILNSLPPNVYFFEILFRISNSPVLIFHKNEIFR